LWNFRGRNNQAGCPVAVGIEGHKFNKAHDDGGFRGHKRQKASTSSSLMPRTRTALDFGGELSAICWAVAMLCITVENDLVSGDALEFIRIEGIEADIDATKASSD